MDLNALLARAQRQRATPRRRSRPRKPKKWLHPAAIEREYVRAVRGVADQTIQAVQRFIIPALSAVRGDDLNRPPEDDRWYNALELAFAEALAAAAVSDEAVRNVIALFAGRVDAFNSAQFHALLRGAYGVDIVTAEPRIAALLRVWEAENLRLIKSIPVQYLDTLQGRIVAAVARGESLRSLTAFVRDTYRLPTERAELIARDQVGKLNGRLTGYRQANVGVTEYRWRGTLDARERDAHVSREGKVIAWDTPPDDGHPGEPIRCRCWAEPVLPDLDDLDALIVH